MNTAFKIVATISLWFGICMLWGIEAYIVDEFLRPWVYSIEGIFANGLGIFTALAVLGTFLGTFILGILATTLIWEDDYPWN